MEQQTVDLGPFLQRIDELIPTEKKDSYYLIVGELLTHFPEYLWQRLGHALGLPSSPMPKTKMWWKHIDNPYRKCRCARCLPRSVRGGRKKAQALIRLTETFGKPLRPEPACETAAEARVRVIEDTIERLKLMEAAGLRVITADRIEHPYHIRMGFEYQLVEARRELRFERGDF